MSGSRQVIRFGDWSKQQLQVKQDSTNILGHLSGVWYTNSVIDHELAIGYDHGKIGLEYKIFEIDHDQLLALGCKLDKEDTETPSDDWRAVYSGNPLHQHSGKKCSDIQLSQKKFSDNFENLNYAIKTLAEFASFPIEMVDDILLEIKSAISNHRAHLEKVTKLLMDGDFQTKNEIQEAYSIYKVGSYSCNHAMAWIHTLVQESRYQEAIIWCNTFSQAVEPKRIILHCLMKLKDAEEKANKKLQLEEKVSTGLDDDENTFAYLEKLFKCSWEIAKSTNNSEDISLALHYLDELSGGSGLERAYIDIKSLNEVDILIQRARIMRELREDNAQSRDAFMPAVPADNGSQNDVENGMEQTKFIQN